MAKQQASIWFRPKGIAALGLIAAASYFLFMEHRQHVFASLPYLILLACPLMHWVIHRVHHHRHDQKMENIMPRATWRYWPLLPLIGCLSLLAACSDHAVPDMSLKADTGRWFSKAQVAVGEKVYEANCISCHKPRARGTVDWKTTLDDGSYPPPPLNGSAHAWHHSLPVLLKTINEGGIPLGGNMPPFKDRLSSDEKFAVIAYFQSFWSNDIYERWNQMDHRQ